MSARYGLRHGRLGGAAGPGRAPLLPRNKRVVGDAQSDWYTRIGYRRKVFRLNRIRVSSIERHPDGLRIGVSWVDPRACHQGL